MPTTIQKETRFDKSTTTWLILMHVGCLLAPFTFTWPAFFCFLILYALTGISISLCFHRLLTHRSFKTPKWVEYAMTLIGCCAAQRSPIYWVARHRQHHANSDKDDDPHSPRHGFWWSHMMWVFHDLRVPNENEYFGKYAPDLASDPGHRWIQKTHELWPLLLAAGLFIFGGLPFLVWGLFVRTVVVYHLTWAVNSLGHIWGSQDFDTGDDSRNNFWIALFTFGDGWHNNHHAFQNAANHGLGFWQFDPNYYLIRMMSWVGLASDIRMVTKKQMERKITP